MNQYDLIVLKPIWQNTYAGYRRLEYGLGVVIKRPPYPHFQSTDSHIEALRGFYYDEPLKMKHRQFKRNLLANMVYGKGFSNLRLVTRHLGKSHFPVGTKVGRLRPGFSGLKQLKTLRRLKKFN